MAETSLWQQRIRNADNVYKSWASKFKCELLEQYYEGFHWKGKRDYFTVNYNPYTTNLVYSTIKTKLASFLFKRPSYLISPTPGNSQWNQDFAVQSAAIKQDVLNTLIHNPNIKFAKQLKLTALDSFFRFGVVEIGYAADWRNPKKEEPHLKSWDNPNISEKQDKIIEDNTVPVNERFFVKRIPAKRFRVSVSESTELDEHEWCTYYEFFYTQGLKKTRGIRWPEDAKNDYISSDYAGGILSNPKIKEDNPEFIRLIAQGAISKVWNIFDMVSHKRFLYLDNRFDTPLWFGEMERLPLVDVRWDQRLEGFYPIPPVFQWLSPQDEINEAREQMRSFRRRFTRKFQAVTGTVEPEEKEKFASGPDGVIVEVKVNDAIKPIQNPEIGATAEHALILAKDDFQTIAGTADVRQSDRETATKSRILDVRSQIRESSDQIDFSEFACLIGREILLQSQEKLVEGLWVKYTSDPSEETGQDMQVKGPIYKWITSAQINDGYDFTIEIDVQNATPAAMQQAQEAFITFCSLLIKFPFIAMSPVLIREAAYRCGYRNERVIQQMQQTAMLAMAAKASQMTGQSGNTASNAAETQLAQQASPTPEQVDEQLNQQVM